MLSYCTQKTTVIIVCYHCYLRCTIIYFILTNHWLSYAYVVVLYTEDHGHYSMPSLLFKVYYYLFHSHQSLTELRLCCRSVVFCVQYDNISVAQSMIGENEINNSTPEITMIAYYNVRGLLCTIRQHKRSSVNDWI
jgi:hypothetical protein